MSHTAGAPKATNFRPLGRSTVRAIGFLAILLSTLALPGRPASAHHCSGGNRLDREGGEASYECHLVGADRDGSGEYSLTPEEQWNQYCVYLTTGRGLAHTTNAKVTYSYHGPMDEETVTRLRYDPTGTYGSFTAHCHHPLPGGSGTGGTYTYNIVPPVPVEDLRAIAKARIDIDDPVIETNPSFTDRFTIVRIETWLWVDRAYWDNEQVESETSGFVTVEVRAKPVLMEWTFNDPDNSYDDCDHPGKPWSTYAGSTDCSVTFLKSSAGQPNDAYQGVADVSWEFSWSLNGTDQGPFDDLFVATTNFELQVGEIQAVGS